MWWNPQQWAEVVERTPLVLAHRLNAEQHLPGLGGLNNLPKAQHNDYVWMPVAELLNNPQVHEHTKAYFQE